MKIQTNHILYRQQNQFHLDLIFLKEGNDLLCRTISVSARRESSIVSEEAIPRANSVCPLHLLYERDGKINDENCPLLVIMWVPE